MYAELERKQLTRRLLCTPVERALQAWWFEGQTDRHSLLIRLVIKFPKAEVCRSELQRTRELKWHRNFVFQCSYPGSDCPVTVLRIQCKLLSHEQVALTLQFA